MTDMAADAAPANETRGEIGLALDGVEFTLRPSYAAIDAFERETGKGLMALFNEAQSGIMPVKTAATIVTHCMRAQAAATGDSAGERVQVKRIAELIVEADGGVMLVLIRLQRLLLNAASGGYTASGEVKAATGTTATPDAA